MRKLIWGVALVSALAVTGCGTSTNANDWSDEKCQAQRVVVLSDDSTSSDAGAYNLHCCKYAADDEHDTVDKMECRP